MIDALNDSNKVSAILLHQCGVVELDHCSSYSVAMASSSSFTITPSRLAISIIGVPSSSTHCRSLDCLGLRSEFRIIKLLLSQSERFNDRINHPSRHVSWMVWKSYNLLRLEWVAVVSMTPALPNEFATEFSQSFFKSLNIQRWI